MNKIIWILILPLLFGCNGVKEQKALDAVRVSGYSQELIVDLPMGFRFGMSSQSMDSVASLLIDSKLIESSFDGFGYQIQFKGKNISTYGDFYFHFYKDKIYQLEYKFSSSLTNNDSESIYEDILSQLKIDYSEYSHYVYSSGNQKYNYFIKDNLSINYLYNGVNGSILTYTNTPIAKDAMKLETEERLKNKVYKDPKIKLNGEMERYVEKECFAAISREDLEGMSVSLDSDQATKMMHDDNKIFILKENDVVLILEPSTKGSKVKVLSGDYKGRVLYIYHSLLTE